MEDNKKGGFSADGRKLRPRRPRVSSERVEYRPSERKSYPGRSQRSYEDRPQRSYDDRPQRSYEDRPQRPYGERRSGFGDGERRGGYGQGGERRTYGDRPRRSFADRSHRDDRPQRSYGDRPQRSYEDRPQRSYDDRPQRSYDDRPQRSYEDRPQRPYGERRSGFGDGERRGGYGQGGERRGGYGKPSFGGRQGYGKPSFGKKGGFRRRDEEKGIDRMLNRKPQVSDMQFSDNDMVPARIQEEVRLNKFIANSGVCSRREADQLIQAGVVTVNGEVVTELGTKVNVLTDEIRFNGERLKGEEKVYIVMNKPKGYVTTASDPHAEKTVMDLLKGCTARVFPVGRLDKNTTGVLMFTNDGDIAEKLTHPSYDKKKIYQVILDRPVSQEDFSLILSGIELNDGPVRADELEYIDSEDHRKIGIEIHSGKNRIVRRIFESLGYDVRALDRVYFAGLTKKGLKKGEWRYLSAGEANILKMGAYM